nr:hypothetical protein [Tanacetum cinerariifolium]
MLFTMRGTYVDRDPKMARPVQNINHSAFRSMFEREKLSGNNFNDWFRQLKLVLRVKKKMFVIEHPIPPAPAADSEANMLAEWNELRSMFEKQAGVERFVRNYNMHNMGKTIGELHTMLIKYENGLPKKAETPQVMMIKDGKIQKAKKKSLKAKAKDDVCHHYKEVGHWKRNCHVYLAELLKKKKQVGSASKMKSKSFPHRPERATGLLEIIHIDLWST